MLKTIDLFAGAGGLSYGFESTREFLIVAAAENNKNARKTYVENHKGRNDIRLIPDVRDYDFSALASEFDGIDVVIGGPPCQGFSNANRQKNHIISMNNSLVKEYFRAVKEIRPKAFVMENVSMLSSETHRFYDSAKDHDVVTSLGVQMREDELVLADSDYNGYSLVNIIQADAVADYKISDELFQLLNVLYKNRNSEERLSKYIKNKSKLIIDKIASQAEEVKNNLGILNWIVTLRYDLRATRHPLRRKHLQLRDSHGRRLRRQRQPLRKRAHALVALEGRHAAQGSRQAKQERPPRHGARRFDAGRLGHAGHLRRGSRYGLRLLDGSVRLLGRGRLDVDQSCAHQLPQALA